MPSGKIRPVSQNYENFGGLNTKASQYLTGPQEFLDLINFDFQSPGNLSKRWGTTQYLANSYTLPILSLYEFERLNGFSQIIFSYTGGVQVGATTTTHQGLSLTPFATGYTAQIQIYYDDGFSGGVFSQQSMSWVGDPIYSGYFDRRGRIFSGQNFQYDATTYGSNLFDYATLQNNLFLADGSNWFKYNGTTLTNISLPIMMRFLNGTTFRRSIGGLDITTDVFIDNGYNYSFIATYVNNRGYESEPGLLANIYTREGFGSGASPIVGSTFFAVTGDSAQSLASVKVMTPLAYGISAINIYAFRTTLATPFVFGTTQLFSNSYRFIRTAAITGSTVQDVLLGATQFNAYSDGALYVSDIKYLIGETFISYYKNPGGAVYEATNTFNPSILEIYNNSLFTAGYTATPSSVFFSDIGEPENYVPENNFEVRTNDGDKISALKAYNSDLYIFKYRSFHQLSGSDPTNYNLREISDQYGCLSNNAVAIYENYMFFLDRKGIMRFNGANIDCMSNKIQGVFETMNIPAARITATMIHDKVRNQILLGIPVNGASTNNLTVVYDYSVEAWTKYDGFNPSVYATIQGRQNNKTTMFGTYSGLIENFSPSLFTDNGASNGYTCLMTTRFLTDEGNSVQKMWRRLFLNDTTNGTTNGYTLNFKQDHGSSTVLTRAMAFNAFQTRMDFGIQAKSISFELTNKSADFIQVNGFVLEHRYLRNV